MAKPSPGNYALYGCREQHPNRDEKEAGAWGMVSLAVMPLVVDFLFRSWFCLQPLSHRTQPNEHRIRNKSIDMPIPSAYQQG